MASVGAEFCEMREPEENEKVEDKGMEEDRRIPQKIEEAHSGKWKYWDLIGEHCKKKKKVKGRQRGREPREQLS